VNRVIDADVEKLKGNIRANLAEGAKAIVEERWTDAQRPLMRVVNLINMLPARANSNRPRPRKEAS
jgi:hypothetical protein